MAIKKVPISFKERERPIYEFLMDKGRLSPSIYVKQLLVGEMEKEPKESNCNNPTHGDLLEV
jgi:hypothetical protein